MFCPSKECVYNSNDLVGFTLYGQCAVFTSNGGSCCCMSWNIVISTLNFFVLKWTKIKYSQGNKFQVSRSVWQGWENCWIKLSLEETVWIGSKHNRKDSVALYKNYIPTAKYLLWGDYLTVLLLLCLSILVWSSGWLSLMIPDPLSGMMVYQAHHSWMHKCICLKV